MKTTVKLYHQPLASLALQLMQKQDGEVLNFNFLFIILILLIL